eukprot:COSAG02_NODE_20708_length_818_cov_1.139082_3_plen_55_part_01
MSVLRAHPAPIRSGRVDLDGEQIIKKARDIDYPRNLDRVCRQFRTQVTNQWLSEN